uniref:Uncharacterized protein n=1 Tax=Oryza sativa subsp. japonica TaxID=39947 RepID=Q8GVU9_ORYSJ|nr:hypothetical protein [Oryza sativa Japonica Group]
MDELGIIDEGVDWRTRLGQDIRDRVTHDILQASTPSVVLLHEKNKHGEIIHAQGNVQGTSSSGHKEPSNPYGKDREIFGSSINKLLLSRDNLDAPMDTFKRDSFAIDRASSWVNHAIKHNAKVVKFAEYERWEPFYLDPKLVEFSSWYLKTRELTNAALNETIFDPLNNACPTLENLVVKECLMEVQQISSSSL